MVSDTAQHNRLISAAAPAGFFRFYDVPPAKEEEHDPDMRHVFLMLWRRKVIILGLMFLGLMLALAAVYIIPPRYEATAVLMLEEEGPEQPLGEDVQSMMSMLGGGSSMILSELEILRSRSLARLVVERLDLLSDPEFNPQLRDIRSVEMLGSAPAFKQLNIYKSELDSLPADIAEMEINMTVTEFLKGLRVRSIPGSLALQIDFTSYDAGKAALIANTLADVYIGQRLEAKIRSAQKMSGWLDERLAVLKQQVREADDEVQEYRVRYNLTEGERRAVVSTEQLSQLNSQLVLAKAQKAEAEARLQQVEDFAKNPGSIEAAAEIINSSLIQNLKHDESRLLAELSDLSTRYGPRHPETINRKAELSDLQKTLKTEMLKIVSSIRNEVSVARARLGVLEENLREIEGRQHHENEAMIKLKELVREAESTRLIYERFLATYKRSDKQEDLQEPHAKIISPAALPMGASSPNGPLWVSLALAISLFFGLGLSLIIEKLDNTYRSAGQLERKLGFPCYALIPQVRKRTQKEVADHVFAKPASTVAEAVRSLRMAVNLRAGGGDKPKIIAMTSSFPGEGKTTLSVWLARLAAKSGEKVILIDGDLRRPNIHKTLGKDNAITLVEYLTGKNTLEEVIQRDDPSGAHIVYGRAVPNSALDLIGSAKMERLVESLGQGYDLVILDSPACLAVSDARVLSNLADHTIYAVGWNKTPREVVEGGVKQFTDMNCEAMSFVLTGVDVERHIKYGYGDTVYYYGRHKEYYAA